MPIMRWTINGIAVSIMLILTLVPTALGASIARIRVSDLFKQADVVATVRILSGDSEHYPVTVYKGEVEKAFKGTAPKEIIYFGQFVSFGVGSEYLVFLSRAEKEIEPKDKPSGFNYGVLSSFFRIMHGGFSIMPIEYACVFEGKDVAQRCDYAVKLNPEQVILPATIKAFPRGEAGALTNYEKWVRQKELVSFLEQAAK